jgi:hypothetical protein
VLGIVYHAYGAYDRYGRHEHRDRLNQWAQIFQSFGVPVTGSLVRGRPSRLLAFWTRLWRGDRGDLHR